MRQSRVRQIARGLGMGVGKVKDWARKEVVPCKSWKIVVVLTKKNRISAEKLLNNIKNNCFGVCRIYSESENVDVLVIRSTQLNICT